MVTEKKYKKLWRDPGEHRLTAPRTPMGRSSLKDALKLSGETNSHAVMFFRNLPHDFIHNPCS